MESEEQIDEQVKMASETVQWMIDKNYVYRTEEGLELTAMAPFRNPCFHWKRTTKGGNSAARKRAQRAKRQ